MTNLEVAPLIKAIHDSIKTQGDSDLKDHHLTFAQSRVLVYLKDREDCQATQKEIEDFLQVSHPTVTGIVSRMEANGIVTCRIDPRDKRNKIVQLTPEALSLSGEMDERVRYLENRMLKGLSQEERETLVDLLQRVLHNVS